ncbi:hypothetical protein QWZ13_13420 [Reinekea marina]|uniref:hypothetical protein n=1 Tax=Reinekea marina TaxID=1310421 RepID=UPI0025B4CCAA|nr:hypothetical protein [Reinekea marina]MDN3649914.1 hypothetical protein [Reinekea marina]
MVSIFKTKDNYTKAHLMNQRLNLSLMALYRSKADLSIMVSPFCSTEGMRFSRIYRFTVISDTLKNSAAFSMDRNSLCIAFPLDKKTDTEISVRNHGAEPTWE